MSRFSFMLLLTTVYFLEETYNSPSHWFEKCERAGT